MNRKDIKALGLLSGGLDSTIAVKLMVKLGYDVTVLNFMSPFCTCTKKSDGCKSAAHKLAGELDLKIKTEFMGGEYLEMLRSPKYGYGSGVNPCVDCRIMMFKQTKTIMDRMGAHFVFTGEVIGQRPMSQVKNRLALIEKECGLKGYIVRPLSAALLEPTVPERKGWIDRQEMLDISGRSRHKQIKVGREMGIPEENLCTSGGCLLTDKHFASKMKDLLGHSEKLSVKETRMLRLGRHFRIADNCKVIVGRNEGENERLERMAMEGNTLMHVKNYNGPCVVVVGDTDNGLGLTAGRIAARYSDAPRDIEVEVELRKTGVDDSETLVVRAIEDSFLEKVRV